MGLAGIIVCVLVPYKCDSFTVSSRKDKNLFSVPRNGKDSQKL